MDTWTRGLDFPLMAQRTSSDTHGNDPSGGQAHCPSVPTLESLLSRLQDQLPFLPISLPEHTISPPFSVSLHLVLFISQQGLTRRARESCLPAPLPRQPPGHPRAPAAPHGVSTQPNGTDLGSQPRLCCPSTPGNVATSQQRWMTPLTGGRCF